MVNLTLRRLALCLGPSSLRSLELCVWSARSVCSLDPVSGLGSGLSILGILRLVLCSCALARNDVGAERGCVVVAEGVGVVLCLLVVRNVVGAL